MSVLCLIQECLLCRAPDNLLLSTPQALSELIPQSVVGLLEDDSSNVVQLISEAYSVSVHSTPLYTSIAQTRTRPFPLGCVVFFFQSQIEKLALE